MTMHMSVQENAQNHLIRCELEEALYVALEGAPNISFHEALKIQKNNVKKKFEVYYTIQYYT